MFSKKLIGSALEKVLPRSSYIRCFSSVPKWVSPSAKTHDWNRAVSDAERMVGSPTTFFSLKTLLSEEFSSVAMHLRKLVGTNHPILKTAKRLVYHGRTNMQTRGLIVLLLSKAVGHSSRCTDLHSLDESGISSRQQTLAEITEMIYTAHLIHKGILNLSNTLLPDSDTRQDLQFGNKISILSGDYLLSNACKGLANLRNCKVVDLVSQSIADFMQAEFLEEVDIQGQPIPSPSGGGASGWHEKHSLSEGSLLANSCQGALALAGWEEIPQKEANAFGKNVALAWQVYDDLQPFVSSSGVSPFVLTSLPVALYLEERPDRVEEIRSQIDGNVANFDYRTLHESVLADDRAIPRTRALLHEYSENAEQYLKSLAPSPAAKALANILHSITD